MFQSIPYLFCVCLPFLLTPTSFFLIYFLPPFFLSSFLLISFLSFSFLSCFFLSCFCLSSFIPVFLSFSRPFFLIIKPFLPFRLFQIYSFILFTTTFLPKETVSRGRSCFRSLKNYSVVFVLALIFQKITFYDFHEIYFLILKMLAETPLNPSSVNRQWFQVPFPHWVQCKCLVFTSHTGLLNDFSGGKLPIRISEEGPKNFYFDFAQ